MGRWDGRFIACAERRSGHRHWRESTRTPTILGGFGIFGGDADRLTAKVGRLCWNTSVGTFRPTRMRWSVRVIDFVHLACDQCHAQPTRHYQYTKTALHLAASGHRSTLHAVHHVGLAYTNGKGYYRVPIEIENNGSSRPPLDRVDDSQAHPTGSLSGAGSGQRPLNQLCQWALRASLPPALCCHGGSPGLSDSESGSGGGCRSGCIAENEPAGSDSAESGLCAG
jgi:hypothetical protein